MRDDCFFSANPPGVEAWRMHLRPELKNLRPATLFIWGEEDKFGPPTPGQEMATMAPKARCEVLSDAGHLIWVDQPERCARLSVDFLKAGERPSASLL
ncbi:MAG: alpha/beta fold hydrolase [Burkholderiales bacterium]